MKTDKRVLHVAMALTLCLALLFSFAACNMVEPELIVTYDSSHKVYEGDGLDSLKPYLTVKYKDVFGIENVISNYTLSGQLAVGDAVVTVTYGSVSTTVTITVLENANGDDNGDDNGDGNEDQQVPEIDLTISKTFIEVNDYANLSYTPNDYDSDIEVEYVFTSGQECVTRIGLSLRGESSGIVSVYVRIDGKISNTVNLQIVDPDDDPYENEVFNWFHGSNYNEATSLEDSYWRTKHNLMSGSIADQDQAPTIASNQPKSGNKFVRNSDAIYLDNGNTYAVVDSRGNVVDKIYKFGAYVTLEEVAAYVYAFGDVPANYIASNSASSLSGNAWKQFLRLNHVYFSGDTYKYPYEPLLPRISGEGGDLDYYEIDIGTTGTDCDPKYDAVPYNTGSKITRGAARIVYTRYYNEGGHIDDLEDRYVFYTYNHYNDFQEYLNYQGGWGQIFGNITGGGVISSKSNYNPTPYVEVVRSKFSELFN